MKKQERKTGQLYGYLESWTDRPVRKFRLHTWLDIKARKPLYGVQVLEAGSKVFAHVFSTNGQPVLFEKEADALEYGMDFLAKHQGPQGACHA